MVYLMWKYISLDLWTQISAFKIAWIKISKKDDLNFATDLLQPVSIHFTAAAWVITICTTFAGTTCFPVTKVYILFFVLWPYIIVSSNDNVWL